MLKPRSQRCAHEAHIPWDHSIMTARHPLSLCVWTGDDLAAVYVIPYFVRDVSSLEYLKVTFKQWIEAAPVRPLHQHHAATPHTARLH